VRSTFDFPYALGSISIDLPFLDWQRVKNEIKLSEADYKIYLLDFEDVINQALNEAAYYYFAYSQANALYTNIQESYQNTVQIATYHKLRYKAGKIELKDYLEALNSKNSAQKDLVQQKYQVIRCENYIYKAMGGKYQAQE